VVTFNVGSTLMMLMLGSGVLVRSEGSGLSVDDGLRLDVGLEVGLGLKLDVGLEVGLGREGAGVAAVAAVELCVELGIAVSV